MDRLNNTFQVNTQFTRIMYALLACTLALSTFLGAHTAFADEEDEAALEAAALEEAQEEEAQKEDEEAAKEAKEAAARAAEEMAARAEAERIAVEAAANEKALTEELSQKKEEVADADKRIESAKKDIAEAAQKVEGFATKLAETQGKIDGLQTDIEDLANQILQSQEEHARLQQQLSNVSVLIYKSDATRLLHILTGSESITDLLDRMYQAEAVASQAARLAEEEKQLASQLQEHYNSMSAQKDEVEAAKADLQKQKADLDAAVADMEANLASLTSERDSLEEERKAIEEAKEAAAAAAAEAALLVPSSSAALFTTRELDADGWYTGPASAYGGSSDPSTPNPGITATGALCDDWSMGVAVPLAWGPSAYYGRMVEISYGGRSIIVVVNDCGGMGGGARHLDLQPGVFKAFGCSTCNDWGVRTVKYRFL